MTHTYIVHYGELGLKGRNRKLFEQQLVTNIKAALNSYCENKVKRFHSHILVELPGKCPVGDIETCLSQIFGIAYFAPVTLVALNMEEITQAALKMAAGIITEEVTFRVTTSRGEKSFPFTSMEVSREVGAHIVAQSRAQVNLWNPDYVVRIQIYQEAAYMFIRRIPGAGGLPVGSSGRILTLFSGGIDSPVAAHLMMKRGCEVDFLHFHLLANQAQIHESKILKMARAVISPHQFPAQVYMVSAAPFEAAVAAQDSRVTTVVFRRFIMRVAQHIAYQSRIPALVTGESVGQVASQTLQNINVISRASDLPILRPLVGMDKREIIDIAQEIGTYTLSIEPYKDPCSMHARHPSTWANIDAVLTLEKTIHMESLLAETIDRYIETITI
ncbi:MAG: tRNA 4-thiouridine(8) synthase ThiI [Anaerolineae bacterium]|nr:tRNA 4-thiouridine(8) synthase ThiI [Anaerolineae bacterium]